MGCGRVEGGGRPVAPIPPRARAPGPFTDMASVSLIRYNIGGIVRGGETARICADSSPDGATMSHRSLIALALLGTLATYPARVSAADFDPTDRYETRDIRGWIVLVHQGLLADHLGLA